MRTKRTSGLLVIFLLTLSCLDSDISSAQAQKQDPWNEVNKFRATRDAEFKDAKESPLVPEAVANFKGLTYFKLNSSHKLRARFVRTPNEKKFDMPTSSGKTRVYVKYGELKFKLKGRQHTLGVYQSDELAKTEKYKNYLLIPFTDVTSGKETYGGGRYIDFEIPATEFVTLDFNLAYNPSCAYSSRYNCPIPPRENRLTVKIEAGERAYIKPAKTGVPER